MCFLKISILFLLKEDFYLKPLFQAGAPHNRLPREALPMRGTHEGYRNDLLACNT